MFTQDEAELYDRQIRLWGVNAQSRIRQSKVLMLGFNGVASEVAKILVLAGIETLTIVDDQTFQDSDLTSNLFCRPTLSNNNSDDERQFRTHQVITKLKTLNPLVKVNIDNSSILSKTSDEYKDYDLVTLHSFLTIEQTGDINNICRQRKIKFYIVLDYGFFGFMFNDLGQEFKFTYEEFCNVSKIGGEKKNPIIMGDDVSIENDNDDIGYGSSDDEDTNPRKKRRINSPDSKSTKGTVNEKQTIVGSLSYVTFNDMISLKDVDFSKQTSPVLIFSIALYKFYTQFKNLPRDDPKVKQEDISKLNEIIVQLKDSLNVHDAVFKKLDKDWSENIYGSLSPTCAVMGGVAGQDMIRALSMKDIPLNNTFAFDGISMNGIVEKVGIPKPEAPSSMKPVVRDILQIDDDD